MLLAGRLRHFFVTCVAGSPGIVDLAEGSVSDMDGKL